MSEQSRKDDEQEEAKRFIQIMPASGLWAVMETDSGKLWKRRVHAWGLEKGGSIKPLVPEYEGFMWNVDEEPGFICLISDEDFLEYGSNLEQIPFVKDWQELRGRQRLKISGAGP